MAVAEGSPEPAPMEPVHCTPKASPSAGSPYRPSLYRRERSSPVKNRKRENCTSGSVRDEDGNILIYSAEGQDFNLTRMTKKSGIMTEGVLRLSEFVTCNNT